jgi:hypothetical protein
MEAISQLHVITALALRAESPVPTEDDAGWPHSRSGQCSPYINVCPCWELNFGLTARSNFTILTELLTALGQY